MIEYSRRFERVELSFIGCPGGFEERLVPAFGFKLVTIPGAPFARQRLGGKVRALRELARGTRAARAVLRSCGVRLVIGLGGYASAGSVLAARSMGIPAIIHEANVSSGFANRVVSRAAQRVCVGWDATRDAFPGRPVTVTGNPIVPDIAAGHANGHILLDGPRRILVAGGSEGSGFLNRRVPDLLARIQSQGIPLDVVHQAGLGEEDPVRRAYAEAKVPARVEGFINGIAQTYRCAQFVISSAGALTLAELAAMGLPALLVPSSVVSAGHQHANAVAFAKSVGGLWVAENDWDPARLSESLGALLTNPAVLEEQARRTRALARPNAARDVIEVCESLMSGSW
jgi:UDP-N-acetylglucosamine--N-acetylmuramyl-(pentapeptide) pyrophosphoryl-undecaprenol N-acetylglucosamine transferase